MGLLQKGLIGVQISLLSWVSIANASSISAEKRTKEFTRQTNVLSCKDFTTVTQFIEEQHLRFDHLPAEEKAALYRSAFEKLGEAFRQIGQPLMAATLSRPQSLAHFKLTEFSNPAQICKKLKSSPYRTAFLKSFARQLDPYSDFYLSEELESKSSALDGEFIGVGIGTEPKGDYLEITEVVAGGPADGLLTVGDQIFRIDDHPVAGLNEAEVRQRIRGAVGTTVKFSGMRKETPLKVELTRNKVQQKAVTYSWIPGQVLVLKVHRFFRQTAIEAEQILSSEGKKARGLILDLRGDPGGLLQAARDLVDLFISQGVVVYLKGKSFADQIWALREGGELDRPMVVLVDSGTASAAEIVAGALQDYGRAVVVGQKTYGKGSVQNIYETQQVMGTEYQGGLKLTTLWYYLPSGRSVGIMEPDFKVPVADTDEQVTPAPRMPYHGDPQIDVPKLQAKSYRNRLNLHKVESIMKAGKDSEDVGRSLLLEMMATK